MRVTLADPRRPVALEMGYQISEESKRALQIRLDRFRGGDYSRVGTIKDTLHNLIFPGPLSPKGESFLWLEPG